MRSERPDPIGPPDGEEQTAEETADQGVTTRATWTHVVRVVISGLFMLGQNKDFDSGAPVIGPARLIIGALIGLAILIGALLLLVLMITR